MDHGCVSAPAYGSACQPLGWSAGYLLAELANAETAAHLTHPPRVIVWYHYLVFRLIDPFRRDNLE
jgi:hypothetical protein